MKRAAKIDGFQLLLRGTCCMKPSLTFDLRTHMVGEENRLQTALSSPCDPHPIRMHTNMCNFFPPSRQGFFWVALAVQVLDL